MKKIKEMKFIDIMIHCFTGFVLLLPILYVITPVIIAALSHTLNITMADINAVWDNSMIHANTTLFTLFTNTGMQDVVEAVLDGFNLDNAFLTNLITYWVLAGALCFLFDSIMQIFIWLICMITPKQKKAD